MGSARDEALGDEVVGCEREVIGMEERSVGMTVKPGKRLFSPVCSAEFIVVRAPGSDAEITIGGRPAMDDSQGGDRAGSAVDGHDGGVLLGKRYVDEAGSIELLCTKAGDGVPALNGEVLDIKAAKALPASD